MSCLLLALLLCASPTPDATPSVPHPPGETHVTEPETPAEPETPEPEAPEPETPAEPEAPAEPEPETPAEPETPEPAEPAAPACPCDPIDWQCMQDNAGACEWGAAAPEPAPEDLELPPRAPSRRPPPPPPPLTEPQRTGFVVGAGIGYLGCRARLCQDTFDGAFGAEGELGYRWRFVAPVLIVAGGRGPFDLPPDLADARATMSFLDFGVGVIVFPAPRTIFDPYFGLTLGAERSRTRIAATNGQDIWVAETTMRGSARFAFGFNFFLAPRVTLGPRFTLNVPFAGKWCLEQHAPSIDEKECVKVKDLAEEQIYDPSVLPRSFAFTVHLRLILPVGR